MKKRQLGHDGPEVGAIALGCMRMSNFQGTTTSRRSPGDAESVSTIEAALDAGINFLDTGDFYGMGHNELLISRAIEERRDDAFLSVKFGAQKSPSGAFLGADLRPNSVQNFAAYSLQRLDVDVIDLYQPGRLDPTIPVEDTVGAIADLIREGKVRYLGLSEVTADQLRKAGAYSLSWGIPAGCRILISMRAKTRSRHHPSVRCRRSSPPQDLRIRARRAL